MRTRAIPERLRGVFTTRRYRNTRLPYLTLPLLILLLLSFLTSPISFCCTLSQNLPNPASQIQQYVISSTVRNFSPCSELKYILVVKITPAGTRSRGYRSNPIDFIANCTLTPSFCLGLQTLLDSVSRLSSRSIATSRIFSQSVVLKSDRRCVRLGSILSSYR